MFTCTGGHRLHALKEPVQLELHNPAFNILVTKGHPHEVILVFFIAHNTDGKHDVVDLRRVCPLALIHGLVHDGVPGYHVYIERRPGTECDSAHEICPKIDG